MHTHCCILITSILITCFVYGFNHFTLRSIQQRRSLHLHTHISCPAYSTSTAPRLACWVPCSSQSTMNQWWTATQTIITLAVCRCESCSSHIVSVHNLLTTAARTIHVSARTLTHINRANVATQRLSSMIQHIYICILCIYIWRVGYWP